MAQMRTLDTVIQALITLRVTPEASEYALHEAVGACLVSCGLPLKHEAVIAPRRRIDWLCGDVGIEIKRGKPPRGQLLAQLDAYMHSESIGALVLVIERSVLLPRTLHCKPLVMISLNRLWGIAL